MTIPTSPGGTASHLTKPLRSLFAWALVGYVGLHVFFEFLDWLLPEGNSRLIDRSSGTDFLGVFTLIFPILAVLIATHVAPVLREAKLVALVALVEYGAILLFGLLSLLLGVVDFVGDIDFTDLLNYIALRLGLLALTALAGYAVFRIWTWLNAPVAAPPTS